MSTKTAAEGETSVILVPALSSPVLEAKFGKMPEATEVSAQISEPMPEFQVAGIQLASQTRLRFWSLNSSEYFKIK